jgi:hypothetical protein
MNKAEILPPGAPDPRKLAPRHESFWFDNERLDLLSHWLDDCFHIPGLPFRFGIDAFIGLVPGFGDILTGLLTCIILVAGWMRGLPYVTLLRMLANIAIDVLIGAVPLLGDVFDIAWKPNRRNFNLLKRDIAEPRMHTWRDWSFLFTLLGCVVLLLLAPVVVVLVLLAWLLSHLLATGMTVHP